MGHTGEHVESSDGELLIRTAVAGRAARMGHRLTIAMSRWRGTVHLDGGRPAAVELTIDVDSLQVLEGEGGITALSGPEKAVVRSNALGCFDARRFPQIRFTAEVVTNTADGYRLTGTLDIHGRTRPQVVDVNVDGRDISSVVAVRQSDFGMKPYSMFMGSLKVVDEVSVSFHARLASP